jgi:WD40 repeat protein
MSGDVSVGVGDEVQRMQDGVRGWVQRAAGRSRGGLRSASPAVILSLLCASALCPLLMPLSGAVSAVLAAVGGGFLAEVISGAVGRLHGPDEGHTASREDLETGIAEQIQRVLAAGGEQSDALRGEIASVLKEIDAGGTALRAAMEQGNERVRNDVIAAIRVLGSDFSELAFLIKESAQAAAEIRKTLDVQGADVRTIIEQNDRQSTDIRLVLEDLAVLAGRTGSGPTDAGPTDGGPRWVRGCPYRGLLPFGETDAEVFYGRERLAAELAVKLAARVSRGGLVIVTGASGAGKSSLLRAGLLPILARGHQIQGSGQWPRIVMTPTKDPLTELAARLAALGSSDTVAVRDGLVQHPDQAHLTAWSAVLAAAARHDEAQSAFGDSAARLVLIVDQFEQIFTLNPGPERAAQRQAFITALHAAATTPVGPKQEPPALVVIAVRGDFWDRCAAFPELAGALQDGQFVVGPMTESELRMAITGPADAAGLRIDSALADTILSDLRATGGDGTAGVLPLLSQAMALTWEKREGDQLTSHGYSQAGGVSHAVQTGADKVYDALPAAQQTIAREVLRSMTVASRDGRLTRRPLSRADLYSGLPSADRAQVDAVLEAFAAERLIVLDEDTAQISHDALLQAWPKLRAWLEEDQARWILYGQLADAATAWHDNNSDPSFLYRGSHLTTLQQAATGWSANPARYPALTGTQRDFLQASERAAIRSTRQRRSAIVILSVLALLASTAAIFAFQQRATAQAARDNAVFNQITAEAGQLRSTDVSLAAQLDVTAYNMRHSPAIYTNMVTAENTPLSIPLIGHSSVVHTVAFSPNGHTLATGGEDQTVRLWNVTDLAHPTPLGQPLTGNVGYVWSVAFSPDGHILAAGGGFDGKIQLWNVTNPAHPTLLGQPLINVGANQSVEFSPDGHILAAGGHATIRLWNVTNPAHPRPLGQPLTNVGPVESVAFSPDGHTLADGSFDGKVRLWNVTDPAHPTPLGQPLTGQTKSVQSVAFSPDGHTLAVGGGDATIRLWNVTDPAHPTPLGQPLTGPSDEIFSVVFSPNGHILAGGSYDDTIWLWNVTDPVHPTPLGQPLTGHTGPVISVAFSPDGHTLASGSVDHTTRLWELPQSVLTGPTGAVWSVVFSPDRHILADVSEDGSVRLWNVTDPAHPTLLGRPLVGPTGYASVAFSPDGHTLADANGLGSVRLWNVTDAAHPTPLGQPLTVPTSYVQSVAFSPHGHTLAAGSGNGNVQLWNITDPAHPTPLGQPLTGPTGAVYSVAFSPNGHTLAAGSGDKTVRLWNVTDPAHPRPLGQPLTGPEDYINSVAFSPNGHTLAVGSGDQTVRLWNVTDPAHPQPLGQPLTGPTSYVSSVAFSPNGHTLAVGSGDKTVWLWNVTDPAHPRPVGQPLTGPTGAVWSVAFSPDGRTLASGGGDDTVRLWEMNAKQAIRWICATSSNNLTGQRWHQYVPEFPFKPPCT